MTVATSPIDRPSQRAMAAARRQIEAWFAQQGWKPFPFQRQAWQAYFTGASGLIHATTGTGKTYAAWLGPVGEWLATHSAAEQQTHSRGSRRQPAIPLQVLWITPLRALAADTVAALQQPLTDMGLPWTLESRTGDTSSTVRNRQRQRLPTALVTTPESLSLMLSRPDARAQFRDLKAVIVDEWHEFLSTKRGVQVELALARLRRWRPNLRTWGLSATLGNLEIALAVLIGPSRRTVSPRLIEGRRRKQLHIDSLIPPTIERFPWAGHLGIRFLPEVVAAIEAARSTLIFTNTRSQAEMWYQAILKARPDWAGELALHHGSISRESRQWVEDGLRNGRLKAVVCTSSLDLGVDFSPVERVLQIGSPKGVARLVQRAGRSGHDPTRPSRATFVPTHALELVEVAALRDVIAAGHLEGRLPRDRPLDVLVQHAVTIAVGSGFERDELLDEIRQTFSFAEVSSVEWDWILDFISRGGEALRAYPDYHKVAFRDGRYVVDNPRIARQHRMSIGTIVSDAMLTVQYLTGGRLGMVEESFLAKLAPGDRFTIAGKTVELVSVNDMHVLVRKATGKDPGRIPRWAGGRMPLSTELAAAIRWRLDAAAQGMYDGPEMTAVRPLLELQQKWSHLPRPDELLVEQVQSREGYHLYLYPFAGRLVHEGLAALIAWRLAQRTPLTCSMSVNDYGFELLSAKPLPLGEALQDGLFSADHLANDIQSCLNAAEMGKRQFREVARIAGLVFQGYPGQPKTARQLQASTGLLYDVFANYDPGNLLLSQARREVLDRQLELSRLLATLESIRAGKIIVRDCERFTPFSFPLMVDRLRERLTSEQLADRVARIQKSLERQADR